MQNVAEREVARRVFRTALFILVKGVRRSAGRPADRPVGLQKQALYKTSFFTLRVPEALLSSLLVNGPSPTLPFRTRKKNVIK